MAAKELITGRLCLQEVERVTHSSVGGPNLSHPHIKVQLEQETGGRLEW